MVRKAKISSKVKFKVVQDYLGRYIRFIRIGK